MFALAVEWWNEEEFMASAEYYAVELQIEAASRRENSAV